MRLPKRASKSNKMKAVFTQENPNERPLGQTTDPLKVLGLAWETNEDCLTLLPGSVIEFERAQANASCSANNSAPLRPSGISVSIYSESKGSEEI
ncbi:hypothetical protein HPB50_010376 [Hyalomma asiaticum]|uniref:Uncharacterized protein n=1 Tax=Hyalomma asiaticum TaxID=266040 RepID=A0ACB7THS9_HYAAI|nr:hypothetical protein HPB50_010376 [Hyalomma asiaticum]